MTTYYFSNSYYHNYKSKQNSNELAIPKHKWQTNTESSLYNKKEPPIYVCRCSCITFDYAIAYVEGANVTYEAHISHL